MQLSTGATLAIQNEQLSVESDTSVARATRFHGFLSAFTSSREVYRASPPSFELLLP